MPGYLCTAPRIISLSPLSLGTDVTDATLGARGLWLGTRTGTGGTATLTESFFGRSPWLYGHQPKRHFKLDVQLCPRTYELLEARNRLSVLDSQWAVAPRENSFI